MDAYLPQYSDGREVHAGDRVRYRDTMGTVAFVSDGDGGEFGTGYEDYRGHQPGIMVCDDDGGLTFLGEADEELEFMGDES